MVLNEIYNAFDPFRPLPAGDPFYVDCRQVRGDGDILVELGQKIFFSDQKTCQLYAGHRGAGKSTELLRLKKHLEDNGCFVVYFAADEEDIDPEDAQYTDILLACTRHLLEELKNVNPKPLLNWLGGRWQEIKDLALTEISLESLSLEGQISQFGKITGNLRAEPSVRQKIREQVNPHTTSLIEALNQFITEAKGKLPSGYSQLAIIADNLDRIVPVIQADGRTNHDHIFIDRCEQLKALDCNLVYTVPISMLYSNKAVEMRDTYGQPHILPMIMVRTPENKVYEPGLNKLKEVIAKRVSQVAPNCSLETDIFEKRETLEQLCLMSGGHVRNLLLLMQQATLRTPNLPITATAVKRAISEARNTYRHTVDDDYWLELAKVSISKKIRNNDLHRGLLFNRCLLEYRYLDTKWEIKRWCDVHPLLKDTDEFREALNQVL